jgi:hypothetical protein
VYGLSDTKFIRIAGPAAVPGTVTGTATGAGTTVLPDGIISMALINEFSTTCTKDIFKVPLPDAIVTGVESI